MVAMAGRISAYLMGFAKAAFYGGQQDAQARQGKDEPHSAS
jgi:hypothetical protein